MRLKRIYAVLSVIMVLALCLTAGSASADGEIHVSTSEYQTDKNNNIEVSVNLSGCKGMDSVQFNLNYDPTSFELFRIMEGDLTEDGYCAYNPDEEGVIRFAFACRDGLVNDSGTMLTVVLTPINDHGTVLTITDVLSSRYDKDTDTQTKAYVTIENGGISVGNNDIPEARITPWIPETPTPSPEPTPEPTPVPTQAPTAIVTETPEPEEETVSSGPNMKILLPAVAGALVLLIIALLIVLLKKR